MGARRNDPISQYARDVKKGTVPAGELVRLACERHLAWLKKPPEKGAYFDLEEALRPIEFFRFLKHSKGEWAGCTFELEPWQKFILGFVFGWKNADGTRIVRVAYIEIPRKNGKTTLAAGVGLYLLVADGEPGAEIYAAATKKDQAKISHEEARRMIKRSPALKKHVRILRDNLSVESTFSKFEPLGADKDTLDGLNIHGVIIDELHAHKDGGVWDVLNTATGSRRQPLVFAITTAGLGGGHSVCRDQHEYAEKILRGVIEDPTFFAYVATIDEGDEWDDPAVWAKANPNLGISVKLRTLEQDCKRAQEIPREQNSFRRYHLNEWTQQETRWIDLKRWDKCRARIKGEELEGALCYGGLDIANTTDIAALVLAFPGPRISAKAYFWVPEEAILERSRRDRVPYDVWAQQGFIKATPGNVIDYKTLRYDLEELAVIYDFREIAYDRWGAVQLMQEMEEAGFTVVPFGQGFTSMSPPSKELERLLVSRGLAHDGNPVLRWMADNVVARMDPAGNIKPDKEKSREKIDGIVALVMALDRALRHENRGSIYETRGIEVI